MRELPEGWAVCKMPEAVFFQEGPGLRKYQYTESGIPFLNIRTIFNGRIHIDLCQFLSKNEVDEKYQHFLLNAGDIICSTSGTLGKTAIVQSQDLPLLLNTSVMRFRSLDEKTVIQGYIHLYLKSDLFLSQAKKASTGSAQVNVGPSHLKEFEFPLPPLNEQKRIADRLDQLLTRIDKTKAHLDRIPPLLKRLRQSVLAAATSGKLTADLCKSDEYEFQEHHVKEPYYHSVSAPAGWDYFDLGTVCEFVGGSQPPKSYFQPEFKPGLIRLIQIRDYKSDRFETYIPVKLARRFCTKDDVMIGRYGPPIFQILRGLEGAYNVALMKAVSRIDNLDREYLYYWLQKDDLLKYVEGGSDRTVGQDGVRKDLLHSYPFFLPSLPEQQEIVRRVEALFAKADRIEAQYKNARQQVDRLTPALLAKAFRGELVPQDPNDEPASVLLERVREARSIGQIKTVQRTKKKIKF